jgi:hypothetical protein
MGWLACRGFAEHGQAEREQGEGDHELPIGGTTRC